jgi:hypothetical protein
MRWGRCVIWAGLALAAASALPAVAGAGWSVTGSVGETVEANDNPQLEPNSSDGAVGSTTNFSRSRMADIARSFNLFSPTPVGECAARENRLDGRGVAESTKDLDSRSPCGTLREPA